jgi:thiol-disulfide isomerase/thioredoxin
MKKNSEILIKFFKSENCPKCKAIEKFIEKLSEKYEVMVCTENDADGLTEISYYSVQAFPSLVIEVKDEVEGIWRSDINREEVKDVLRKINLDFK